MLVGPLWAQVYTRRLPAGTATISQFGAFGPNTAAPKATLQAVDAAPLLAEDQQRDKLGLPARLGVDVPAAVDLMQAAAKSIVNGYQVSTYQFDMPGAPGVSVVFDDFRLAEGARMFLYNADRTLLIGPVTSRQNGHDFRTDLLEGSSALIEVQEPVAVAGQSRVHVSKVVQYYRFAPRFGFGTSGPCELNTICYPDYQNEADGVTLLLTNYGPYTYACTGSMVNSTQQDFRSYLLTAFHCFDFSEDGTQSPVELAAAATTQIRFHWESPTCTTAADNVYLTLTGAEFRAAYANSDFTLLELTQQVPPAENVTYLGWDRNATLPAAPFGIHHPSADLKKISFSPNATTLVNVTPGYDYLIGPGDTHLQVTWAPFATNLGVTEGGSSGSPLFDQNRRLVGQLHGGGSYCFNPTSPDQYGRFFTSWTGGATAQTRLSNWLDPVGMAALTTNSAKSVITGPTILAAQGSFSLNSGSAAVTSWTVTGGAGIVSPVTGSGNAATLTALSAGTNLTITFGIAAGQSYPIRFSRQFDVASPPAPPLPANPSALTITSFTCYSTNGALTSVDFVVGRSDGSFLPAVPDLFINGITITGQLGQSYSLSFDANQYMLAVADQATRTLYFVWDFRQACTNGSIPPKPPVPPLPANPSALTITSFTCYSTNGALTSVDFVVGRSDGSFLPAVPDLFINGITITGQLGQSYSLSFDANQYMLAVADQATRTLYFVWDFRQACTNRYNQTRVSAEAVNPLAIRVLGNPVGEVVDVDVTGAEGEPLTLLLSDVQGRLLGQQRIEQAGRSERVRFRVSQPLVGLLVLRATTPTQAQSIRLLTTK